VTGAAIAGAPSREGQYLRETLNWQLGDLPEGYDHKYIYSHLGYNLKPLDSRPPSDASSSKNSPRLLKRAV